VFLNGCVRSWRDVGQPECASGDAASPTTVALVGDSHAAMWQRALDPIAQQWHWRLETVSKVLCPLQDLLINSPISGGSTPTVSSGVAKLFPVKRRNVHA
jgi:SGNH domain (fused to AT3 domains)